VKVPHASTDCEDSGEHFFSLLLQWLADTNSSGVGECFLDG
jgi:hypothetical protein